MPAAFVFDSETFRPLCVKDDQKPEFDIVAVGGSARARLKSIVLATSGLAQSREWSPDVQDAVIKAFETGAPVFAEGVTAIRYLTAPAKMLKHVGMIREYAPGIEDTTEIPVTRGYEFSMLCGFWPVLAYEIAMAIAKVSKQADIDPRFFDWLSISLGLPVNQSGTAGRVESEPGKSATADSRPGSAGSRKRGTSPRSRSSAKSGAARTAKTK